MELVEVPMTDRVDVMSVENGTTVTVLVFNVSDYLQADSFVRIKQIKDSDVPLRNVCLSHVTSLRNSSSSVVLINLAALYR